MLDFYAAVRFDDVDLDADGDMLLFQWGTYDWGSGERFEIDITRQFICGSGEDDDIWQLHLTYHFSPDADLRAIAKGDRWCSGPEELAEFRTFVTSHRSLSAVESRDDGVVKVEYERAG